MGIIKKIFGKTLYYPGCLTKGVLEKEFENYKWIFNKLGVDFIMIPEEVCCGLPVLNAGHKKEARELAKKNLELFESKNVKKIVTSCPSCYHMFKEVYPSISIEWKNSDIEVEHATVTILNALKNKNGLIKKARRKGAEEVSYHDPCHLGRYSNIYDEPREVIGLLGGKIIEMKKNKEDAFCCGGGGGVRANFPELAKKIASLKSDYAKGDKIISPCGLCFKNIESATEKSEEFSSFVRRRLE